MTGTAPLPGRRPLTSRDRTWAKASAGWLARHRISPNVISCASVVFAICAATALVLWPGTDGLLRIGLLVAAIAGIQLRLICNLLDGMVAVEGGLHSATGGLFNEVPDRIADSVIIIAIGYGLGELPWAIDLAWAAALAAMLTAYIRTLGGSLKVDGCFHGPMAKPQRMALITLACMVSAVLGSWDQVRWILWSCLPLITVGALITSWRRLRAIATHLRRIPS